MTYHVGNPDTKRAAAVAVSSACAAGRRWSCSPPSTAARSAGAGLNDGGATDRPVPVLQRPAARIERCPDYELAPACGTHHPGTRPDTARQGQ